MKVQGIYRKKEESLSHLQVANGSIEGIVAQASFFVQELARLAVGGWCEESIVEALLQLLQ